MASGKSNDVDHARRLLLKAGLYVAPAVVATLTVRSASAQIRPSCAPATCSPVTNPCGPGLNTGGTPACGPVGCRPRG